MLDDLNDQNFLIYAAKCYTSPHCVQLEFDSDIKHIKYIRRLIKRYRDTGELKERLILNHIIVLSNVFGTAPAVRMLFLKVKASDYPVLKTFLLSLNFMPDIVLAVGGRHIRSSDIEVDQVVASKLRGLLNNEETVRPD